MMEWTTRIRNYWWLVTHHKQESITSCHFWDCSDSSGCPKIRGCLIVLTLTHDVVGWLSRLIASFLAVFQVHWCPSMISFALTSYLKHHDLRRRQEISFAVPCKDKSLSRGLLYLRPNCLVYHDLRRVGIARPLRGHDIMPLAIRDIFGLICVRSYTTLVGHVRSGLSLCQPFGDKSHAQCRCNQLRICSVAGLQTRCLWLFTLTAATANQKLPSGSHMTQIVSLVYICSLSKPCWLQLAFALHHNQGELNSTIWVAYDTIVFIRLWVLATAWQPRETALPAMYSNIEQKPMEHQADYFWTCASAPCASGPQGKAKWHSPMIITIVSDRIRFLCSWHMQSWWQPFIRPAVVGLKASTAGRIDK
jgi:hypothetical protein